MTTPIMNTSGQATPQSRATETARQQPDDGLPPEPSFQPLEVHDEAAVSPDHVIDAQLSLTDTADSASSEALIVIGMDAPSVQECWDGPRVIATISDLVGRARVAEVPVVWVHGDDEDAGIDPLPAPGEMIVQRIYRDGFASTDLDDTLRSLGAQRLYFCGLNCFDALRATFFSAVARGYSSVLVSDAQTSPALSTDDLTISGEAVVAIMNDIASAPGSPQADSAALPAADIDFRQSTRPDETELELSDDDADDSDDEL